MARKKDPLTPKQRRFIQEYVVDWNATQAAVRAGYSEASANREGSRLLSNVDIQRAVQRAMRALADRAEIRGEAVLRELAAVAFSQIDDYAADEQGRVRLRRGVQRSALRAVASVKVRKKVRRVKGTSDPELEDVDVQTEIRLWPKVEALKQLAEYTGVLEREDATAHEPLHLEIEVIDRREQVRADPNEGLG